MTCKNCKKDVDKKCDNKDECTFYKLRPVTPKDLPKPKKDGKTK